MYGLGTVSFLFFSSKKNKKKQRKRPANVEKNRSDSGGAWSHNCDVCVRIKLRLIKIKENKYIDLKYSKLILIY